MAEFCEQCAKDLCFPYGDFKGMTTKADWDEGKAAQVLCEGCGFIQVDPEGNCVTKDCFKKHGSK
jgi:hypothetical protein